MNKGLLLILIGIFILGFMTSIALSNYMYNKENNTQEDPTGNLINNPIVIKNSNAVIEQLSPYDWITEDKIHVYNDQIIIDLPNARWAKFTDTNSMDPVIDEGANAIEIVPASTKDIHLGDIVSYKSNLVDGTVIHRVVEIGNDSNGWFIRLKGDNTQKIDPEYVRFEQIQRVVVAIIY